MRYPAKNTVASIGQTNKNKLVNLLLISAALAGWQLHPMGPAVVENMGETINTAEDEFSPSLTADGKELFFNTRKPGERYMNIYRSLAADDKKFTTPHKVTELCSEYNDEAPFIAPDGSYILFASDRDGSLEMPKDAQGVIRVSFDLYIAYRQGKSFSRPIRLPGKVNSPHHEKAPYVHSDGYLYFTRYPFGDISRAHILRAKPLGDGSFGEGEPLPAEINSGHQEVSLTGAPGGFYFSSKRPGSMGWDIYYIAHVPAAGGKAESWGQAIRLPEPINSDKNETFLSRSGNYFYFSSNRDGGYGRFDLYGARETRAETKLRFLVRDKNTGAPVKTTVLLTAQAGNQRADLEKTTDPWGRFEVVVHPSVSAFEIKLEQEGYLPVYRELKLAEVADGSEIILELERAEPNSSFTVHAIHFDFNSAVLRNSSLPYLDALAGYLKRNANIKLLIIGHTDLTGSEEFNLKLSRERANAVRDYLHKKGVAQDRLQTEGAGKSRPLVQRNDATADELNRRTEFKILAK